ncbi:MAG: Type I Iterative PKS [Bathelium mastoideum]|nr:MAG: Type I Iterative PKS [Bathelium mastoideum]
MAPFIEDAVVNQPISEHNVHSSPKNGNDLVAIVGMGCRLPGGVHSPSSLWDLLIEGRSGHGPLPPSRYNAKGFYDAKPDMSDSISAPSGYFLNTDSRLFDNNFFGINNLEAKYMDPQQRQLLEVVYESFENAGITLDKLSSANVGCYVANFLADYQLAQSKGPELFHRYSATGMGITLLSNRISHAFNLKGPSVTLDTACSASLYALHMACAALARRECDAAIVAGANLIHSPESNIAISKTGFTSPDGICHTFDEKASGYGRAEGVGALFLKRLDDAIKDGDPIRSVVRGTAVNSNGRTNGIFLPSADGQEAAIRKAYLTSGLNTSETDYVEAHGTGTSVGDPIEVDALSRVIRHRSGRPSLIGAVKTNLGHSEAVSGITGVIKVTLALEKGLIPPTIGVEQLNPQLLVKERNVKIVTEVTPWPETSVPRASINSFGYGGANAHAILEAVSAHVPKNGLSRNRHNDANNQLLLLPFSASTQKSLQQMVSRIIHAPAGRWRIDDLAYTLCSRRSRLRSRGFIVKPKGASTKDVDMTTLSTNETVEASTAPLAFVFTGQGAQWPEMGRSLYLRYDIYRHCIDKLDRVLSELPSRPSWTLRETMFEPERISSIHTASRSQPACTAVQIALVELMRSWNIVPQAVVGHSSGEIAASFAAGHITSEQAILIAYHRGRAVSDISSQGAMLAVGLDEHSASQHIQDCQLQESLSIACINSPNSVTISGGTDAADKLSAHLHIRDVFCRKLRTDNKAYHSKQMLEISADYGQSLVDIFPSALPSRPAQASTLMISSITGRPVEQSSTKSPNYWKTNLVSPVQFKAAIETLLERGPYDVVEVGPHSALKLPIAQTHEQIHPEKKLGYSYESTLSRSKDSVETILQLAGTLYLRGHNLELTRLNNLFGEGENPKTNKMAINRCRVLTDLPNYPWNHDTLLWHESRVSQEYKQRKYPRHTLLGSRLPGDNGVTLVWKNFLTIDENPWIEEHKLGLTVVFPAAGYISIAAEAIRQLSNADELLDSVLEFRHVKIVNPLVLQSGVEIMTQLRRRQVTASATSKKWWDFEITSHSENISTMHANGSLGFDNRSVAIKPIFSQATLAGDYDDQKPNKWYDKASQCSFNVGPAFQPLTKILSDKYKKRRVIKGKTKFKSLISSTGYRNPIHPITIDAALQSAWFASAAGSVENLEGKVPVSIESLHMRFLENDWDEKMLDVYGASEFVGYQNITSRAELVGKDGRVLAMHGVRWNPYVEASTYKELRQEERHPMFRVLWKPDISRLSTENISTYQSYINDYMVSNLGRFSDPDTAFVTGIVDVYAHKDPRMRVLEVGNSSLKVTESLLDILHVDKPMQKCRIFQRASFSQTAELVGRDVKTIEDEEESAESVHLEPKFDLIVLLHSDEHDLSMDKEIDRVLPYLEQSGSLLAVAPKDSRLSKKYETVELYPTSTPTASTKKVMVIRNSLPQPRQSEPTSNLVIITRNKDCQFAKSLREDFSFCYGRGFKCLALCEISEAMIPHRAVVVCTVELFEPLLGDVRHEELEAIKILTERSSAIIWLSGGNLYWAQKPNYAPIFGLARAVSQETPSLKFLTLDVDPTDTELAAVKKNTLVLLEQAISPSPTDLEYLQQDGVLHISRFVPESSMNRQFQMRQNRGIITRPLQEAGVCALGIEKLGQVDSLHFVEQDPRQDDLAPWELEIKPQCFGLNAKDYYVLFGHVDTKGATAAVEFGGIVTRTGSASLDFAPGDRVVAFTPNHFTTLERAPAWACCKLRNEEDMTVMSTIPTVVGTAVYALEDRARIEPGESILIHSAASSVGIAAIQLAKQYSAEIYATTSSPEKKAFLVEQLGIQENRIFQSRDSTFLPAIMEATSGRGVDVVLNFLTGDLLHEGWRACAEFGRFVEIGKSDLANGGRLDMDVFNRSVTFTAFDLETLFYSRKHQQRFSLLLDQSFELVRSGKIKMMPAPKVFDVTEIVAAFRTLSLSSRIGKVVVSLNNPKSLIKVIPKRYSARFDPDKSYFLVGCLGGLGRSLAMWMLRQGARKFVFLGRSGISKVPAQLMVSDLERSGAEVRVIRGDVCDLGAVQKAIKVSSSLGVIGGVVQAAMGLGEALFSRMSSERWHMGVDPKIQGTWNIHNALKGHDNHLDFFLLTSSVSGSIGSATESNYCAANSFQDSFARWRKSQGLPAIAVGLGMISEVGYIHEHPEIEALFMRKGLRPISESELLQIIDIALTDETTEESAYGDKHFIRGHLLTGMEPQDVQGGGKKGFDSISKLLEDPRSSIVARILNPEVEKQGAGQKAGVKNSRLPATVVRALAEGGNSEAVASVLEAVVGEKISHLLLLPADQLAPQRPLADFGLDSMLGAEFKQSIYHNFEIDVPFMTLLAAGTSVRSLAKLMAEGLVAKRDEKANSGV